MRLLQKHLSGFTLIELLITVAIASLVVGGGIAGFVGFSDREEVRNTAKEVQQMMRTAQSKARVRDVPTNCGTVGLTSYQFYVGTNNVNYRALCGVNTAADPAAIYVYPAGVTASRFPNSPDTIRFTTLEGGVVNTSDQPISLMTYTFTKGSYSFSFTVSSSGAISNVE